MDDVALTTLMTWLSPSYPVGAYCYSHGLEWAVSAGDVTDRASLEAWIADVLTQGGGRNDAILFRHAHEVVERGDDAGLAEVCETALALATTAERRLETTAQGGAFIQVTTAAWPSQTLERLSQVWDGPVAYPLAVAVAAAGHRIAATPALHAYLHAFAANVVSAGVRLIPLGQTDGQRVIAALAPVIGEVAEAARRGDLDDLGGAAIRAEIAAMAHETQTTRLFRT